MLRSTTAIIAIAAMISPAANACSCIQHRSQADADRAGERVFRSADLIVDATIGNRTANANLDTNVICNTPGRTPRADEIGKTERNDHTLDVRRTLKGIAPARPILAGSEIAVSGNGCTVLVSSCEPSFRGGERVILVLRRQDDGRYRTMSMCDVEALRRSRRGQALFKRAG